MTIGSDMVFELKCLRCRTVYRSEVAHVGKTLKCACGCLVKIVPPLKSLTDTAGTPTRRTPATLSIKELTFWFAVAGALVVAGIFISRLTSEKVRSADQNNSSLSVRDQPTQGMPTGAIPGFSGPQLVIPWRQVHVSIRTSVRMAMENLLSRMGRTKMLPSGYTTRAAILFVPFSFRLTVQDVSVKFQKGHTVSVHNWSGLRRVGRFIPLAARVF